MICVETNGSGQAAIHGATKENPSNMVEIVILYKIYLLNQMPQICQVQVLKVLIPHDFRLLVFFFFSLISILHGLLKCTSKFEKVNMWWSTNIFQNLPYLVQRIKGCSMNWSWCYCWLINENAPTWSISFPFCYLM